MSAPSNPVSSAPVVLVAGASGGLGPVLAKTLQDQGMIVYGTMRNPPATDTAYPFEMLAMDVTDDGSVETCLNDLMQRTGKIDVVINCVNQMVLGAVDEISVDEVKQLYDVNLFGAMRLAKAAARHMRAQGHGTLVTMSSLGGILAVPLMSTYTSCKFALEAFSEALYHELRPYNVDVVIMQPVAMKMDRAGHTDHMRLAAEVPANSATHTMYARMEKDTDASPLTPEMVSEEIAKVLKMKDKPLRRPMDRAKVLKWVARLAPQSIINKLIDGLVPR